MRSKPTCEEQRPAQLPMEVGQAGVRRPAHPRKLLFNETSVAGEPANSMGWAFQYTHDFC
jgi:hypothetical protein